MHPLKDPSSAYRTVEFDALVLGSKGKDLVRLCFDRALASLDRALAAERFTPRSRALSDALLAITALKQGVEETAALGPILTEFYTTAAGAISTAIMRFDPIPLNALRNDLSDIREALCAAG